MKIIDIITIIGFCIMFYWSISEIVTDIKDSK